MSGQLDFLVPPLRGPVLARDQAHAMNAAEVPVDERVPGLGLVAGTVGQAQVPLCIVIPRVRFQEGILIAGPGLAVAPVTVEHVLARADELSRSGHSTLVDRVSSHQASMTD